MNDLELDAQREANTLKWACQLAAWTRDNYWRGAIVSVLSNLQADCRCGNIDPSVVTGAILKEMGNFPPCFPVESSKGRETIAVQRSESGLL